MMTTDPYQFETFLSKNVGCFNYLRHIQFCHMYTGSSATWNTWGSGLTTLLKLLNHSEFQNLSYYEYCHVYTRPHQFGKYIKNQHSMESCFPRSPQPQLTYHEQKIHTESNTRQNLRSCETATKLNHPYDGSTAHRKNATFTASVTMSLHSATNSALYPNVQAPAQPSSMSSVAFLSNSQF